MTLFKAKGRKYFSVEFTDIGGKKVRKSTKCESKREAQRVSLSVIQEHNDNISNGNSINQDCKLSVLFDKVYQDRWSHGKDNQTISSRIPKLLSVIGEELLVSKVTPKTGLELTNHLLSKGVTQSTCNRYLSLLTTALKDARDTYEIIKIVPKFRKFKEQAKKDRFVTIGEEEVILQTIERDEFRDLVVILLDTGIRLSACLNIKPHNIDLVNNHITIFGEEQKGTKHRSIPMTERVKEIIIRRTANSESLFVMSKDACTAYMRKLKVKLPEIYQDISLHTFRHTFASRLVQSGVSLYVVQYLLGHASIKTTERYAHLDTNSVEEAISNLNIKGERKC